MNTMSTTKTGQPKDTWPRNPNHHDALYTILKAENQVDRRYPGADQIARKLSRGERVRTTIQAEDIWTGGPGNFLQKEADPEGVGTIIMQLDPTIWRSLWLQGALENLVAGAKERMLEKERALKEARKKHGHYEHGLTLVTRRIDRSRQ